jgi:hypothetical protein
MTKTPLLTIVVGALLIAVPCVFADDPASSWPQEISAGDWIVTMYQPQIDSLEGNAVEARAAVSVKKADGSGEPAFGAVWVSATVDVDRDTREVAVREVEIPEVRFADSKEEDRVALATLLETEMPKWEITFDLDHVIADLGVDAEYATTPGLKSEPPVFVHSTEPAVLLLFDGEPKTELLKGADGFESVVNTPFPVVRQKGAKDYFLFGGEDYWYSATDPMGPWMPTTSVPKAIRDLTENVEAPEEFEGDETVGEIPPPKIIVATEPTELIVTQGEPKWKPVDNLDLLYLDNSDSDVFLDISTQKYYVLAAGRWFAGTAVEKTFTWENVPNDELPEAFSDIPADSVNGHVLAHVAGTEQAREEALQNTIPQTASVKRDDKSFKVAYDGDPKFEPVVDLPEVRYAVNTASSVFIANGKYWACDNAIWYSASLATGPWSVATEIPASLYKIPASNPHHNVTYVHIYETTPQVVYVGYTPGYVGSYWYRGCVVWGTGWRYNPWWGPYYYPRPWTWGLNVHYNPWYGWSFGVSWSNGPFRISMGWGGGYYNPWYRPGWGGWYGPGGYRPPYYRPYPPPGYSKPRPTPYGVGGARPAQLPAGARPATRPSNNIYNRPATRDRVVSTPSTRDRVRPAPANRPNDVLTDRSGNVYRPGQGGGWETRENGQWKPAQGLDRPTTRPTTPSTPSTRPAQPSTGPSTRPSTRPAPSTRPSTGATRPQIERDYRSRQRGSTRVQQRPSTPSRSMSRPAPRRR